MPRFLSRLAVSLLAFSPLAYGALCNVPGRQDATCLSPIAFNGPAQPTCAGGQTTVTPATWLGSHWSNPVCQSLIPPAPSQLVCTYGFASGPTWNGSTWAYVCNPPPVVYSPGTCSRFTTAGTTWPYSSQSPTFGFMIATTGAYLSCYSGQLAMALWNGNHQGIYLGLTTGYSSGWNGGVYVGGVSVNDYSGGQASTGTWHFAQSCANGVCSISIMNCLGSRGRPSALVNCQNPGYLGSYGY